MDKIEKNLKQTTEEQGEERKILEEHKVKLNQNMYKQYQNMEKQKKERNERTNGKKKSKYEQTFRKDET